MYVSRLTFHPLPGKTQEIVMRTHYGSLGAPVLVFEQEVANPDALEHQIK